MLRRLRDVAVCAVFGAFILVYGYELRSASTDPPSNGVAGVAGGGIGRIKQIGADLRGWKWGESDPALTFFTFCLVCVGAIQAGLFVYQLRYMRIGLKDTENAANAARDAVNAQRDEFNATHRPKIRIKHVVLKKDIWQGEPIVIDVTCVNNGTANATLLQIGIDYFVVREERPLPIRTAINAVRNYGARLEVGRNCLITDIDINRILSAEENADIQQNRARLYCVGYISYLDGGQRMRITGFCRVLTLPKIEVARTVENCRFRRFRDPDYEYED
jgi:hypothetical protein